MMAAKSILVGTVLAGVLLPLTGCAAQSDSRAVAAVEPASTSLPAERAEAIDRQFATLTELGMFNGTVLVDIGGEIVFQRSYGYSNYELRAPFTERTMFRIASLSKGMTDAALAGMIVSGQLRLDTRVADYLPSFPRGRDITIQMLVSHTSGIPHPNDTAWGDGSRPVTLDEIVAQLARMPLDFEPGAREQYSNGGFAVLTKIMEIASRETYPQFMQRLVFDPLQMRDTGVFGDSRASIPNMASGYEPGRTYGARRRSRPYFPEARPGGGSIYASAADMLTFARAAYRHGLPGTREYRDLFGGAGETHGATGRAPGFFATAYHSAPEDVIVVILSSNYSWPTQLGSNTARLALGEEPPFFVVPQTDLARTAPADSPWLGRWFYLTGQEENDLVIRRDEAGRLIDDTENDSSYALVPMAEGGYIEPMFHKRCQMRADDPNRIDCRPFGETGFTMELQRRR